MQQKLNKKIEQETDENKRNALLAQKEASATTYADNTKCKSI